MKESPAQTQTRKVKELIEQQDSHVNTEVGSGSIMIMMHFCSLIKVMAARRSQPREPR